MKTSPYLVILFLKILVTCVVAQNHPRIHRQPQQHRQQPQQPQRGGRLFRDDLTKIRRSSEVFFVNLEDGFFGCQVDYLLFIALRSLKNDVMKVLFLKLSKDLTKIF